MKVTFEPGKKVEGDKKMFIEANAEQVSMIDLAGLINQFALNELLIIDKEQNFSREKHFWFENLINKAIEDAKNHINWFKTPEEYLMQFKNSPFFCPEKTIKKFIEERKNEN